MTHPGILMWALVIIQLLVYEAWALTTHHETLSRAVYVLSGWGPFQGLVGFVVGGLFVHFFWHWDPTNPKDRRG